MDKGKTPMDLYQQEVGMPKPQTPEDVLSRFNYLKDVRDDHFLRGDVYSNNAIEDIPDNKPNNKK